ncbi:TraB/GumN family protein [Pseudoprimorskyibacter insulae]|uniref:TraB/GumN family protein n=1 Tax=Pseudoprimorskyibacter insulae TaxID=1695997 RepID=UPI0015E836BD|nr:TraB/GumN family protein [Pseudoprimorskyibacter insulae]
MRAGLSDVDRAGLRRHLGVQPYAHGNHWLATRGDTALNIIGTLHIRDSRLQAPFARIAPLVEQADLVLLEMTRQEKAEMEIALSTNPTLLVLEGKGLPDLLSEAQWGVLSDAVAQRGVPSFLAARFQPWYLTMLLSFPPCLDMQAVEDGGLDAQILQQAETSDVPTLALEPFDTVFRAFGTMPIETQVELLMASVTDAQDSADQLATLTASYFDQAHQEGWAVAQLLAQRQSTLAPARLDEVYDLLSDLLLTQRNTAWLPRILEAAEGKTAVVAVGAAHLGGRNGVLQLLADQGFTLTRQPF